MRTVDLRISIDLTGHLFVDFGGDPTLAKVMSRDGVTLLGNWPVHVGRRFSFRGPRRPYQFAVLVAAAAWFAKSARTPAEAFVFPDQVYDFPHFGKVGKERETNRVAAEDSLRNTLRKLVGTWDDPCGLFEVLEDCQFRLVVESDVVDLEALGQLLHLRLPMTTQAETILALSSTWDALVQVATKAFGRDEPRSWYVALADLCGGVSLGSTGLFPAFWIDDEAPDNLRDVRREYEAVLRWHPCGCFIPGMSGTSGLCTSCGRRLCKACAAPARGGRGCPGCGGPFCSGCVGLCRETFHPLDDRQAPARCHGCGRTTCVNCLWIPNPTREFPRDSEGAATELEVVCLACAPQTTFTPDLHIKASEARDPLADLQRVLAVPPVGGDSITDEDLLRHGGLYCTWSPWWSPPVVVADDSDDKDDRESPGRPVLKSLLALRGATWLIERLAREGKIELRESDGRLVFRLHDGSGA